MREVIRVLFLIGLVFGMWMTAAGFIKSMPWEEKYNWVLAFLLLMVAFALVMKM